MLTEADQPGSPDYWLIRLGIDLKNDLPRLRMLENYDKGHHPLPFGNQKLREAYRRFQQMSRTNYTGLVVESLRERLRPIGIRSGADATEPQDKSSWDRWQSNAMDAEFKVIVHRALSMGRAYALVGVDPDTGKALMTSENPLQCIHLSDPLRPRRVAVSLKTWVDPYSGHAMADVYDDVSVYHYEGAAQEVRWEDVGFWTHLSSETHGLGENPMVPFINRRERSDMGYSEFEDVTSIQDRINTSILDRLVIQSMQAYRQRAITGWSGVKDPETGQTTVPFDPGADLLWGIGEKDAKFFEFQQADLTQILAAIADDVKDLAAITRTPPHYLLANVANVSGDALASAESGLTIKGMDRIAELGESGEHMLRLAARVEGDVLPDDASLVWAATERHTLAEKSDAAAKWAAAGVPFIAIALMLGFSQAEAEALDKKRQKDQLLQQAQLAAAGGGFGGGPNRPGSSPSSGPSGSGPDAAGKKPNPGTAT